MVPRTAATFVQYAAGKYPVVTITGPRQAGKTTLAQAAFPGKPYLNMENPSDRQRALADPVAFFALYPDGLILDEFQKAPELVSYIQVIADQQRRNGLFVLIGSQQLAVSETVSQSLAGRTAMIRLLPFSLQEMPVKLSVDEAIYSGGYPRIFDQNLNPSLALGDYVETYVERDVRQVLAVRELSLFRRFLALCAGRVGCLLDVNALANEVGVSRTTISHWLSVLEAGYIAFLLQPWHNNISKRLVKSPKLYFYDTGLAACLMGIENARQVATHPQRGNLFENLVVTEVLKAHYHRGERHDLFFYRDYQSHEVDLLIQHGHQFLPIEIKSSATFHPTFARGFANLPASLPLTANPPVVVYGGQDDQLISAVRLTNPWKLWEVVAQASQPARVMS